MLTNEKIKMLEAQKREIENQLRELKYSDKNACVGRAKLSYVHFSAPHPDYWSISIKCNKVVLEGCKNVKWSSVIQSETKEDALTQIQEVITDLQGLYDKLRGEANE